jgi:hypothetical protein
MIHKHLRYIIAAAFAATSGSSLALSEYEKESNDSFTSPQRLMVANKGEVITITGIIGVNTPPLPNPLTDLKPDVDFYSFFGKAGDVIKINIDEGMKSGSSVRSLDSMIAIFGPDGTVLRQRNDVLPAEIDRPGSIHMRDPRMENVLLPVSGMYTVGVTSDARYADGSMRIFVDGGGTTPYAATSQANGSYKLIIEGASPSVKQINIDIKPGTKKAARINPNSKKKIKVALLSSKDLNDPSKDFDATKADRASITFGPKDGPGTSGLCGKTGTDANYRKDDDDDDDDDDDNKDRRAVKDVDRDGRLDLVCRFEIRAAGFDESDTEGMIKGTVDGMPFEGLGWLKVIPVRKRYHDDD